MGGTVVACLSTISLLLDDEILASSFSWSNSLSRLTVSPVIQVLRPCDITFSPRVSVRFLLSTMANKWQLTDSRDPPFGFTVNGASKSSLSSFFFPPS